MWCLVASFARYAGASLPKYERPSFDCYQKHTFLKLNFNSYPITWLHHPCLNCFTMSGVIPRRSCDGFVIPLQLACHEVYLPSYRNVGLLLDLFVFAVNQVYHWPSLTKVCSSVSSTRLARQLLTAAAN